ncbi:MAG: glycyl-tRNA synthetase, beta subunit [Burkholderiales bacterium]|jgi:glycyl-tRNA synthetase beta chain|nr:glycyl-tRNA synthetase, beta subunit [Burkholderiales bacterium]
MNKRANLLVEFLTEELPPINLEQNIGINFSNNLADLLKNFISPQTNIKPFVSPRRFGCIIHDVLESEENTQSIRRGPAINNALKNETPTPALLGFAKSCNLNWRELEQNSDGYFYAKIDIKGRKLEHVLEEAIITSLKKLPIAKNMRWGDNEYSFVRPMHNLLILHGDKVISSNNTIMGLSANNYTFGHRVMSHGPIEIKHADDYLQDITHKGMVIAGFRERLENIQKQLNSQAKTLNLTINDMPGLLEEVAALVEYPVVLHGEFDPLFLAVPQECLILSMAKNQKYFALLDLDKKLSNKFLFVANIKSPNPEVIIKGNEKVLGARLQDAKFFFDVDKKYPLGKFVDKLSTVVYHNKLGSQLDRIVRLQNIASMIAEVFNVNPDIARSTAYLLKADLSSEMVGEFPELQGVMGKYYAKFHGESDEVANAIEKHYYPRFSGDSLPNDNLSVVMSLADKLETLVGIWGIGLQPSGDKDPFALRRAALGIIRILLKHDLDILQLLKISYSAFSDKYQLDSNTVDETYQFILSRLENYLSADYSLNCIRSILKTKPSRFTQIPGLLSTLDNFARKNLEILQANKRIENILSKNGYLSKENYQPEFSINLLSDDAEKVLYKHLENSGSEVDSLITQQNWEEYFKNLGNLTPAITGFFDNVMVMTDNLDLQKNRIALLFKFYILANKLCKLSELD